MCKWLRETNASFSPPCCQLASDYLIPQKNVFPNASEHHHLGRRLFLFLLFCPAVCPTAVSITFLMQRLVQMFHL